MRLVLRLEEDDGSSIAEAVSKLGAREAAELLRRVEVLGHALALEVLGKAEYCHQLIDPIAGAAIARVRRG